MDNNLTNSETNNSVINSSALTTNMPYLLVIPEYFNICLLLIGVYGIYRGVEISHPIYFILFVNLIIPLSVSVINIIAYQITSTKKYLMMASSLSGLCLAFHCNCWCVTSIIRYLYIVHENWIHNKIPNFKHQCIVALAATLASLFSLMAPSFVYSISIGNIHNFKSFLFKKMKKNF